MWELHGLHETTILHAAKLRGAEVRYVLCDGLFAECDVWWAATNPREPNACTICQAHQAVLMRKMATDFEWLGRYTTTEERKAARVWAQALDAPELPHAVHDGRPIGEWMRSSVHSHFRLSQLDLGDPRVEHAYRGYVQSGVVAAYGLSRLLDDFQPDVLLQFNGRQSSTRVALELAKERGIRVLTHERGGRRGSLTLAENEACVSMKPVRATWTDWKDVPLGADELEWTRVYQLEREHGQNHNWKVFSPPPQPLDAVRARLGLRRGHPLWVLFTSSDDELAAEPDWRGVLPSQPDFIERTVAFAAAHPEIDLVVRAHPNTGGSKSTGRNEALLCLYDELAARLPANVVLVRPDDEVSSYTLMDLCELGIVWNSSVAIELALKGKRAVIGSGCIVRGTEFVHDVDDDAGYEGLLESLVGAGPLPLELRRLAFRWAYATYRRRDVPFPQIEMPDPHTGRVAYSGLADLVPGRSHELDRVCRILLEGEPVALPPGSAERGRTTAAEDAFFAEEAAPAAAPAAPAPAGDGPKVSVVIPCYGYAHLLPETVESVLAQTFQDFEILVVDDGSPDDTATVAQRLIEAHPKAAISLLRRPNSGQPAVARNTGIARARGELILCLDADDLLEPTFLELMVAALDARPDLSIAYGGQRDFTEDEVLPVWSHPPYDFRALTRTNLLGCASMFRRSAWQEVGGYPTDVPGYEDWAFWIALGARGHYAAHVPDAVFRYRVKPDGMAGHGTERDAAHKARIVLANPGVYTPLQQEWARLILAGDPDALAVAGPVGVIPWFTNDPHAPDLRPKPAVTTPDVATSGATRTLALVDAIVEEPELFAAWSSVAAPDETLVLLAPGADADAVTTRVVETAQRAGVNIDAVDVVLLTAPLEPAEVRRLALEAHAVLSGPVTHPDLAVLDRRLAA
jgi:hypothetical protein